MKLHTIYSPQGEKFEVSKPNFDDLRRHYGWSNTPPDTSAAAIAAATKDNSHGEKANAAGATRAAEPTPVPAEAGSAEQGGTEAGEGREEGAAEAEVNPADEKAALIAELKDRFNFDADKRWNVTKLTAKRDELAAAAE